MNSFTLIFQKPLFTLSAGFGTSSFLRLPRYQRAGPSTSLDESC